MKSDPSLTGTFRRVIQPSCRSYCVATTAGMLLLLIAYSVLRWQGGDHRPEAGVNVCSNRSDSRDTEVKQAVVDESHNAAVSSEQGERDTPLLQRVTLEFLGDDIDLNFHLGKEGRGYSKGERVRPGHISRWTGWKYPALRELGEGDHSVANLEDRLSQQQRYTLRIDP